LGKFFVTGNHEYYSSTAAWIKKAEDLGFNVRQNGHYTIESNLSILTLSGVTDIHDERFDKAHAFP
jgi:uncharacterized protein